MTDTAKSQIGIWYLQDAGDFPWINYLKSGQGWTSQTAYAGGYPPPTLLNANGYPNGGSSPDIQTVFYVEALTEYSGNWVLTWTGTVAGAGFGFSGGYSNVSGTLTGTNGRCVFQLTDAGSTKRGIYFGIPAASNLTAVCFMRADEETRYNAGAIFNSKFLAVMASSGAGVIRFMDWLVTNSSVVTTWATRKPQDYISYGGPETRASMYGSTMAKSGATYTLTAPSGWSGLVDKATVLYHIPAGGTQPSSAITSASAGTSGKVRITIDSTTGYATGNSVAIAGGTLSGGGLGVQTYTITVINGTQLDLTGTTYAGDTNPGGTCLLRYTLSVGGTTAKFMNTLGGGAISHPNLTPVAGRLGVAVYDADLDCWCSDGGNTNGNFGLENGAPLECCISLCNELNMSPWFNIPTFACDPITDYASSLAALCISTLDADLVPRYECINEEWNTQFFCWTYAVYKAFAHWAWPLAYQDGHQWYGKIVSTVGQAISAAYGADRTKYQMMCGFQTRNTFTFEAAARLTSDRYVALNGGSAASNWATHCCLANYFSPSSYGSAQEATWAAEWEAGDATVKAARIASYLDDCRDTITGTGATIPEIASRFAEFVTTWPAYDGKIACYEGGYSPDYYSQSSAAERFRKASKSGPDLENLIQEMYDAVIAAGGCNPSAYMLAGANNTWSVWDPDIYASPTPPQWTAIIAFNAAGGVVPPATAIARPRVRMR